MAPIGKAHDQSKTDNKNNILWCKELSRKKNKHHLQELHKYYYQMYDRIAGTTARFNHSIDVTNKIKMMKNELSVSLGIKINDFKYHKDMTESHFSLMRGIEQLYKQFNEDDEINDTVESADDNVNNKHLYRYGGSLHDETLRNLGLTSAPLSSNDAKKSEFDFKDKIVTEDQRKQLKRASANLPKISNFRLKTVNKQSLITSENKSNLSLLKTKVKNVISIIKTLKILKNQKSNYQILSKKDSMDLQMMNMKYSLSNIDWNWDDNTDIVSSSCPIQPTRGIYKLIKSDLRFLKQPTFEGVTSVFKPLKDKLSTDQILEFNPTVLNGNVYNDYEETLISAEQRFRKISAEPFSNVIPKTKIFSNQDHLKIIAKEEYHKKTSDVNRNLSLNSQGKQFESNRISVTKPKFSYVNKDPQPNLNNSPLNGQSKRPHKYYQPWYSKLKNQYKYQSISNKKQFKLIKRFLPDEIGILVQPSCVAELNEYLKRRKKIIEKRKMNELKKIYKEKQEVAVKLKKKIENIVEKKKKSLREYLEKFKTRLRDTENLFETANNIYESRNPFKQIGNLNNDINKAKLRNSNKLSVNGVNDKSRKVIDSSLNLVLSHLTQEIKKKKMREKNLMRKCWKINTNYIYQKRNYLRKGEYTEKDFYKSNLIKDVELMGIIVSDDDEFNNETIGTNKKVISNIILSVIENLLNKQSENLGENINFYLYKYLSNRTFRFNESTNNIFKSVNQYRPVTPKKTLYTITIIEVVKKKRLSDNCKVLRYRTPKSNDCLFF